jgi:hypothetical protein
MNCRDRACPVCTDNVFLEYIYILRSIGQYDDDLELDEAVWICKRYESE